MQTVQRRFLLVALVAILLGCILGAALSALYIRLYPPVFAGGAYPDELADGYQSHYLAMVIDSYILNRNVDEAQTRLREFDEETKIRALGRWSANYVAVGRAPEAQAVNELAAELKQKENWSEQTISAVASQLASEYQEDSAKAQAITTFANDLGQVKVEAGTAEAQEPAEAEAVPPEAAPAEAGGWDWRLILGCCLGLLVIALLAFVLYRFLSSRQQKTKKPEIVWEGEGPPPLKRWSGTYTLGDDTYDEFFTIETADGDFLGESGVGILEAIPNTSPKQVVAFDVGLFDKTDITTLSRVVMSEHAYHDETIRSKIENNPQAEAVLAEPGKSFTLETSALRVEATIDALEYAGEDKVYFEKLAVTLNVFLKEDADLRIGQMDVPDEFKM
jgi:hypothetical protein